MKKVLVLILFCSICNIATAKYRTHFTIEVDTVEVDTLYEDDTLASSPQTTNQTEELFTQINEKAWDLCARGRFDEAIDLIYPYAQRGDKNAQNSLGSFYKEKKDGSNALFWLKRSATQGCANAQFNLGLIYDKRYGTHKGIVQDDIKAKKYYMDAINNENGGLASKYSVINLWCIYRDEHNDVLAKELLEKSVKEKIETCHAPRLLAQYYDKNTSKAFSLYRLAAENGDNVAQYELAQYFEEGLLVEKDFAEAVKWYQKAADQGNWSAQDNLGTCYEKLYRKTLDKRHLILALKWYYNGTKDDKVIHLGTINKSDSNKWEANAEDPLEHFYEEGVLDAHKYTSFMQWKEEVVAKLAIDSDVDINIPKNAKSNGVYALIIANENYEYEQFVPYAENDGVVFSKYCESTLGIPANNIHTVIDAGLNKMKRELDWIVQMASTSNCRKIIIYYTGHGVPSEDQQTSYLLPTDGYAKDPSTGFNLQDIYNKLNNLRAETFLFLDACFSGARKDGSMLISSRGVAIKTKEIQPQGNTFVMSACQGDETAFPYADQKHGLFTYCLLKKLQKDKGMSTLQNLYDYVKENVNNLSITVNNKRQTPTIIPSQDMIGCWQKLKLN